MKFHSRLILSVCFSLSVSFASVIADTGFIALGRLQGNSNFGGPDFNVTGTFEWGTGGAIFSGNLTPTTAIPVTTNILWRSGTVTYLGTPYSIPNPVSDTSGTVISGNLSGVPVAITGAGIFYGNFSGNGTLRLRNTNNPFVPFNFDTTWSGQGIVAITVTTNQIGPVTNFIVTDMVYTFTPEPATNVLIGSVFVGLVILKRRRGSSVTSPVA